MPKPMIIPWWILNTKNNSRDYFLQGSFMFLTRNEGGSKVELQNAPNTNLFINVWGTMYMKWGLASVFSERVIILLCAETWLDPGQRSSREEKIEPLPCLWCYGCPAGQSTQQPQTRLNLLYSSSNSSSLPMLQPWSETASIHTIFHSLYLYPTAAPAPDSDADAVALKDMKYASSSSMQRHILCPYYFWTILTPSLPPLSPLFKIYVPKIH